MSEKRVARVRVSERLLLEALGMPDGVEVHRVQMSPIVLGEIELVVSCDGFPEVKDGEIIPTASVIHGEAGFKGFKVRK